MTACYKINNCCDSNIEKDYTVQAWQVICYIYLYCLKAASITSLSEDPTRCHPKKGNKPQYLGRCFKALRISLD